MPGASLINSVDAQTNAASSNGGGILRLASAHLKANGNWQTVTLIAEIRHAVRGLYRCGQIATRIVSTRRSNLVAAAFFALEESWHGACSR